MYNTHANFRPPLYSQNCMHYNQDIKVADDCVRSRGNVALAASFILWMLCLRRQNWNTWNTPGFLWTWKNLGGILCNIGEQESCAIAKITARCALY